MENKAEEPKIPSKRATFIFWIVGAVVIIALAAAGYFYIFREKPDSQNKNQMANTIVNENNNLNTNSAANTNTTAQIVPDGWQLVTCQRADHGFTFQVPDNWTTTVGWSGFRETDYLAGASFSEDDKYLTLSVYYFNNSESSFEVWLAKRKEAIKDETIIDEEKITINNVEAGIIETEYSQVISGEKYIKTYAYIPRGDKIYKIEIDGKYNIHEPYSQAISQIVESFKFIDVKPFVEIKSISSGQELSESLAYDLEINWLTEPQQLNFKEDLLTRIDSGITNREYYKVGTVTNGLYKDMALLNIFEMPEGPYFYPILYRVIYDEENQTFTYLVKTSDELSDYVKENFAYDPASTISALANLPAKIILPNSDLKLAAELYSLNKKFSAYENLELLFTDGAAGQVYFDPETKCFLIKTPDSLVKLYYLELNFLNNFSAPEYAFSSISFIPRITWSNGSQVTEEYTYNERTGCGSSHCQSLFTAEELGGEDILQIAGQTATGDNVYEYKDQNAQFLKDTYEEYGVPYQEEQVSYEEFVSDHPVFYWEDPFGRYLRFKKAEYLPMAECAKPVIYLYPEKEQAINVQVSPNGGFSYTEPAYPADGWQVNAFPDGRLEIGGEIYPYLFWEGYGLDYKSPTKGFVVNKEEVGAFLAEKLKALGLNEKESQEFIEFWQPKLSVAPYYFITFVEQALFDSLAPLNVNPAPDTIIRVFMDYKPLDRPINVEPLEIRTPQRNGFTVVEWGGANRH